MGQEPKAKENTIRKFEKAQRNKENTIRKFEKAQRNKEKQRENKTVAREGTRKQRRTQMNHERMKGNSKEKAKRKQSES